MFPGLRLVTPYLPDKAIPGSTKEFFQPRCTAKLHEKLESFDSKTSTLREASYNEEWLSEVMSLTGYFPRMNHKGSFIDPGTAFIANAPINLMLLVMNINSRQRQWSLQHAATFVLHVLRTPLSRPSLPQQVPRDYAFSGFRPLCSTSLEEGSFRDKD